jgi:hypothetical protein
MAGADAPAIRQNTEAPASEELIEVTKLYNRPARSSTSKTTITKPSPPLG